MKWFFFVFCCRCCFRFAFGCPFALMRALFLDWHCWIAKCKNYNKKIEMKWKKKRRRKKRWQWQRQRQQYAYLAQFNIDLETIHFNSIQFEFEILWKTLLEMETVITHAPRTTMDIWTMRMVALPAYTTRWHSLHLHRLNVLCEMCSFPRRREEKTERNIRKNQHRPC